MPLAKGVDSPLKLEDKKNKEMPPTVESVGAEINDLEQDRAIFTDPDETRRRRTIKLTKENSSWGFTLQTYGIKHKKTNEIEIMTYVDYVDYNSPAWFAGMQKGDVILSVNGKNVENLKHKELVERIKECGTALRLVVLFENCSHRVELHERYIKLKKLLEGKIKEMKMLDELEHRFYEERGINRLDLWRQSLRSNCSSQSSWDKYSFIESPDNYNNSYSSLSVKDTAMMLPSSSNLSLSSKLDFSTNFIPNVCDDSVSFCDEDLVDVSCASSDSDEQVLTPDFKSTSKVHFDWSFSSTDDSEKSERTLKMMEQDSLVLLPETLSEKDCTGNSSSDICLTESAACEVQSPDETDYSFTEEIHASEASNFPTYSFETIPNICITDFDEDSECIPKDNIHTSNELHDQDKLNEDKPNEDNDLMSDITEEKSPDTVFGDAEADESYSSEEEDEVLNNNQCLDSGANKENFSEEKCDENRNIYSTTHEELDDKSIIVGACSPPEHNVYMDTCHNTFSKSFKDMLLNDLDEDTWL